MDDTLCSGYPYENSIPKAFAKDLLISLKEKGHTIILHTARGMGRSAGNAGLAVASIGKMTLNQLDDWGFVYDELYFGKPSYDIAFDDKAFNVTCYSDIELVLQDKGIHGTNY